MHVTNTSPLTITLSRRNLETLMKLLDTGAAMPNLYRVVKPHGLVIICAEENDEHYATRPMGIGPEDIA